MRSTSLLQQERRSLHGHARFYKELAEYNILREQGGERWLPELKIVDQIIPKISLRWPSDTVIELTFISIGQRIAGFPHRRGHWPFTPPDIRVRSGQIPASLQQCMEGDRILILQPDWSPACKSPKSP